jgi:hypothetical protein
MVICSVPLPERLLLMLGFRTRIGIGALDKIAPHAAVAPTSIVLPPESNPTRKVWMRSVTVARTNAFAGNPVSVQIEGGGFVAEQVCTPATEDGKLIATSVEGLPAVSPVAV